MISTAVKIALRSPHRRFKTGAVLIKGKKVLATGWSHPCSMHLHLYSMHAEQHLLRRVNLDDVEGATIYVATISGKNGNITSGRPCIDCVTALRHVGVARVCYTTSSGPQELDLATCMNEDFKDYRTRWQLSA